MKKGIVILFVLCSVVLYSQKELSPSDWKMTQAKMFFEDKQIQNALDIYLELVPEYSENDFLNLRIAECYIDLFNYENALVHLKVAKDSNPNSEYIDDIVFWFGRVYQKMNDFTKAIEYYEKVKAGTEKVDSLIVQNLIAQCNSGKALKTKKGNFSIENCGNSVNSEFNEIFPVAAFGDDKLYFTSDRAINENQDAHPSTGLYKYSVLESYIKDGQFLKAEVPDQVFSNSKDYILTSVGPGNGEFVLYKNSPEFEDNGDLYYLKLTDEFDISRPVNMGETVNSFKFDGAASLDFINQKLYFSSNSNNKNGEAKDIFYSNKRNSNFSNSLIVSEFNSEFDEDFVYIHPGGDFVVFTSNNDKSMGGYDLFISILKDKKWSEPINLGYPFNSVEDEKQFSLSVDGNYAYISSDRPGGEGRMDIYRVEFGTYLQENFGFHPRLTVIQGQVTDDNGDEIAAKIVIKSDQKNCYNQKVEANLDGYFAAVVKPGYSYEIEIKEGAYEKYNLTVDLTDSSRASVNFDVELETKE